MSTSEREVIIIGGGIGGCAAALRAVQYHRKVLWIRGDKTTAKKSRSQWVANIDNMIGIHEGIVRSKLAKRLGRPATADARRALDAVEHLHIGTRDLVQNTAARIEEQYSDFIEVVEAIADGASRDGDTFVVTSGGAEYRAPFVVLATGVMDRQPSIKRTKAGEELDQPKWIYPFANRETVLYCIRCEGHLTAETCTAVIGAGEAAAQLAMMLFERYGSGCSVLTNGDEPSWKPKSGALLEAYGIAVHRERIVDLEGNRGKLNRIALEGGAQVDVDFALVSLGLYRVYNDLARALGAELTDPEDPVEVRHVRIDAHGESSVPGLFAVGDMTRRPDEAVMKQIYTAQEYAVRAVDAIDWRIRRAHRVKVLDSL